MGQNPALKAITERKRLNERRSHIAFQMGLDAAIFAANEVFSMGESRAPRFVEAYNRAVAEMMHLIHDDAKDDEDIEYSRQKIDEALKKIVGAENFVEWDERYYK